MPGLFATDDPAGTLRERLRHVPRAEKRLVPVVRTIARSLVRAGLLAEAREIIEAALDAEWDDELGGLYADCAVDAEMAPLLERGEAWRVRHPREPGLLLTLGRLCAIAGLWGKAREYLELSDRGAAFARGPCRACARVFDVTGRGEDANRHFRLAATLQFGA